jgi:hypothetical protein
MLAFKLSNCVLCWGLLAAAACGSPDTSLFSRCEGSRCGGSSAAGAGQGGLAPVPGERAQSGAGQGAGAGTNAGSDSSLAGFVGGGDSAGGPSSFGGAGAAGGPSSLGGAGAAGGPSPGRGVASGCVPQVGAVSTLFLYNGADSACSLNLAPPRTGSWFAFDDGTCVPPVGSKVSVQTGDHNDSACYVQGTGEGATDWGGGIGFALNGSGASPCEYDASAYSGVLIYVKGSAAATQGPNYQPAASTLRVNVVTTATSDVYGTCTPVDGKCNDHFGVWCTLGSAWARCDVPFGNLSQRGWGAVKHFDKAQLLQIQLVALRDPGASAATNWDISVDDVAFYP